MVVHETTLTLQAAGDFQNTLALESGFWFDLEMRCLKKDLHEYLPKVLRSKL